MTALAEALRILVGGVFVLAALTKLSTFVEDAERLLLPRRVTPTQRRVLLMVLLAAETLLGIIVTFQLLNRYLAIGLLALSLSFLSWYGTLSIRNTGSCGCFGGSRTSLETVPALYLRNTLLGVGGAAGLLMGGGPGVPSPWGLVSGLLLPWFLLLSASVSLSALQTTGRGRTLIRHGRVLLRGRRAIV